MSPNGPVTPEKVLRSFNTWSFKREQPTDPHLMLQFLSKSISLAHPVSFVAYWGKGLRCRLDHPDIQCLDFLAAFARRVREVYEPGAAITLIFTDTHAELNGHSQHAMRRYFAEVEAGARQRGFESCSMSPLTHAAKVAAENDPDDKPVPDEILLNLTASARKWYQGNGPAERAAQVYYKMNMVEKRAVELAFPRSIFVTFNGSKLRALFPTRLPIFYMYSLRRGVAHKPWFLPLDARPCDNCSCQCIAVQPERDDRTL
jgi:L-tyrosine isonitrile synthase